jgi:Glu-tRNA(Gln) amidotransferase subunit E-like FAD-binding protein
MSMNPQMLEMMKQMDFSQEKVQEQFSQLGLKPEDVMSKVMSTPDLAAGFANPKVQQAIFDISQNPMNITKYQNDPEVMNVLNKVTEVFSPSAMGGPSQ